MDFSLIIIRPYKKKTYYRLEDAVFPLFFALQRLGFTVEILLNKTNANSQNIIFGSCAIPQEITPFLPKNSIIYNLEPMVPNGFLGEFGYLDHLKNFEVWDYSEANITALKEKDIHATHAPLGYVQEMSRLKRKKNPDINMLYYGGPETDDTRKAILKIMKDSGFGIHIAKGVYGAKRDALIYRSKCVLNLHKYYVPAILEEVRLGYLWANKIPVISEVRDTIIPDHLREACFFVPYDEIPEKSKSLIYDKKALEHQGNKGFLAFSSKPLETSLQQLVGKKKFISSAPSDEMAQPIDLSCLEQPKKETYFEKIQKKWLKSKKAQKVSSKDGDHTTLAKNNPAKTIKEVIVDYNGNGPTEWLIKKDLIK